MNKGRWLRRIIFTVGLLICLYPLVSRAVNQVRIQYDLRQVQQDKRAQEARAKELAKNDSQPLMTDFGTSNVRRKLNKQLLGTLSIPDLKVALPLFDNVSEAALNHGAGVIPGSSPPVGGKGTHSIISAHAGLPSKEFFSNLHKLKKGKTFLITVAGKTRAYKVDSIHTVLPTETKYLLKEPGKDLVTLLTCTPVPANTHRLLVRGHRVPYTPHLAKAAAVANDTALWRNLLILAGVVLIAIAAGSYIYIRHRRKKLANK